MAVKITTWLEPETTVELGQPLVLEIVATGATRYEWTKDGDGPIGTERTFDVPEAADTHSGTYVVTVHGATADDKEQSQTLVTVTKPASQAPAEPPPEWDPAFVRSSASWAGLIVGVLALPIVVTLFLDKARAPAIVALDLVLIGLAAAGAGGWIAILELRGRSRAVDRLTAAARGDSRSLDKVAEKAPEIIKEFGALKSSAALMLVAIVALLCATAISWRSLPDSGGTSGTTTTTTTAPPTTT